MEPTKPGGPQKPIQRGPSEKASRPLDKKVSAYIEEQTPYEFTKAQLPGRSDIKGKKDISRWDDLVKKIKLLFSQLFRRITTPSEKKSTEVAKAAKEISSPPAAEQKEARALREVSTPPKVEKQRFTGITKANVDAALVFFKTIPEEARSAEDVAAAVNVSCEEALAKNIEKIETTLGFLEAKKSLLEAEDRLNTLEKLGGSVADKKKALKEQQDKITKQLESRIEAATSALPELEDLTGRIAAQPASQKPAIEEKEQNVAMLKLDLDGDEEAVPPRIGKAGELQVRRNELGLKVDQQLSVEKFEEKKWKDDFEPASKALSSEHGEQIATVKKEIASTKDKDVDKKAEYRTLLGKLEAKYILDKEELEESLKSAVAAEKERLQLEKEAVDPEVKRLKQEIADLKAKISAEESALRDLKRAEATNEPEALKLEAEKELFLQAKLKPALKEFVEAYVQSEMVASFTNQDPTLYAGKYLDDHAESLKTKIAQQFTSKGYEAPTALIEESIKSLKH